MATKRQKGIDPEELKQQVLITIASKQLKGLSYDDLYNSLQDYITDVSRESIKATVKDLIYTGVLSVSASQVDKKSKDYKRGDISNKVTIDIGEKAGLKIGKFVRHITGKGTIQGIETYNTPDGATHERQVNYMIPSSDCKMYNDGSLVRYILSEDNNGYIKANIVDVIKEGKNTIYGAFRDSRDGIVFVPVDVKRFGDKILLEKSPEYENHLGQLCGITIDTFCDHRENKVTGITDFGAENDPHNYTKMVMEEYGYKKEFAENVVAQVDDLDDKLTPEDYRGKVDYRDIPFVAIDPKTCKDRDDAMYAEPVYVGDRLVGYTLMVAIADVSHYVTEGSPVYKEALRRQFSKYLGDEVVPMIPKKLSNGLCSLNKDEDRLSMVTTMMIDLDGNVKSFDVKEGIVTIRENLCYEDASALHQGDMEAMSRVGEYKSLVDTFYQVNTALGKSFKNRGALKITGTEPTIVYSADGKTIVDYKNDNDLDSHEIVEKPMIITNIVIATLLKTLGVTIPNRVEEDPSEERCEDMASKLSYLGIDVEPIPTCENYQKILRLIKENKKIETIANNIVIRSLKKAKYSTDANIGHSSIGNNPMDKKSYVCATNDSYISYAHFTSPIRRDVDLVLHHKLKQSLAVIDDVAKREGIDQDKNLSEYLLDIVRHTKNEFDTVNDIDAMESVCYRANTAEEKDDEAEKICDARLAALYLKDNEMGKVKNGIITSVDGHSATVLLYDEEDKAHSNIFEVNVPTKKLVASKSKCELLNSNGVTVASIGDEVKVLITECEPINGSVKGLADFQKELNLTNYDD